MISRFSNKLAVFLLIAFIIFGSFFPLKPAKAIPVEDIPALIWNKVSEFTSTLWRKAGSVAFQRTLTTALNKIAYDTATWVGSGHQGQKPLFITNPWTYLGNIGDEAAGQFLETFVNNLNREDPQNCDSNYEACMSKCVPVGGENDQFSACVNACVKQSTACASRNVSTINATPSFNVCQPSSLGAKIKIGLGLVEQTRPQGPNCTMSEIVKNWSTDSVMKAAGLGGTGLTGEEYLSHFQDFFDPRANDLGIYVSAQADLKDQQGKRVAYEEQLFQVNKGWLDVRNIAGDSSGAPGSAERETDSAKRLQETNIGTITGDAFIDAANVFINQYAISAFNELMRSLTDKGKTGSYSIQSSLKNPYTDPGAYYGISALKDVTTKLLQPNFGVRTDYDILSSLVICPDPKNPGPDNCVIDDQFMQAISEKKTVAEALEGNYLHGEWQLTNEDNPSTYNLRDLSILRKYRIVPVGWEEAVRKIVAVNPPKKATLNDLVSCFSNTDKFITFSADFDQRDQNWCAGLVDPNWVLKAPLNYCRQEGIGGQILNKTVVPNADGVSEISIIRADKYCADSQTCIKEKVDGSCEAYGYCNEEKRTWNFGSDSCSAINNTCQAFTSTSGQNVAYLQNTLDYDNCDSESAGCRQYSLNGSYEAANNKVSWNPSYSSYFDKNLSGCNNTDEGCTGLFRVKPTWGSNLVMNADFGNDQIGDATSAGRINDWTLVGSNGQIVDSAEEPGGRQGKAMRVITQGPMGGVYSMPSVSLLPKDLETIPGQAYTLSADIYLENGNDVRLIIGADPSSPYAKVSNIVGQWQRVSVTRPADSQYIEPSFGILATGPVGTTMYVMNIKFEMGNWDTGYSPYGSFKVYEKILPSYLEQSCYINAATGDYRLKSDAPAACSLFARKCNKSEVGCESYISSADNFKISATVTSADYCPSQCLGYDVYIAKGSYFSSPSPDKIIPNTAKTCAASSVGCMEFTNLDDITQGGEGKEYYSSLKQCIKPSTSECATFYSWEGTGSGYQLRAYSLKKNVAGLPAVTSNDSTICNAITYRLPVSDPGYNPDCREYYNAAGQVDYHLSSRTITCSDNCHAYRMTDKNIDQSLSLSQCTGADKYWDASSSSCNVCLNGGTWDNNRSACVYQAIPGEGQSCKAAENGCREYNGSRGANVKMLFSYDFENGLDGWDSNCSNGISYSTVANSNNGHSLQYNNSVSCNNSIGVQSSVSTSRRRIIEQLIAGDNLAAQLDVAGFVNQGSAYTIRFIARSATDVSLKAFFLNPDTSERSYFNNSLSLEIKGGNEWGIYQINLDELGHKVGADEILAITASGTFNLDDFVMSEITDRYYLIKNSSAVPDICSYDIFDNFQGDEYNLGCSQYTDRSGQGHSIHKFSSLCADSAVGCEQMIDTHNYAPYQAGYWQDGQAVTQCDINDLGCLVVPSDSGVYAVYDSTKLCTAANQGCSRLGEGQGGANLSGWVDVYKKNNPDQYSSTLCGADNVGCEEWRNPSNGQDSYFKNPGTAACIYRAPSNPSVATKSWFAVPVKRCDLNSDGVIKDVTGYNEQTGLECISDNDCSTGNKCVVDLNDYNCSFTYYKTLGMGGAGNQIPVPDNKAGLCDAAFSSCTEYIDPVSRSAANMVINPIYEPTDGRIEGWGANSIVGWDGQSAQDKRQFIRIRPNQMYSLVYKPVGNSSPTGTVYLEFKNVVKALQVDNELGPDVTSVSVSASNNPVIFNSLHNDFALLYDGDSSKRIEVKEIMMGYQLADNIDKSSCNGLADFDNGCILFNERNISGASGLADLSSGWDPFRTEDNQPPQVCAPGSSSCTANQLIKVRPDRVCARWVDCISYVQDPFTKKKTCYAFAECDRLDDKGECANYTNLEAAVNPIITTNQNSTGYTPANKYSLSDMRVLGKNIENIEEGFDDFSSVCNDNYCIIGDPEAAKKATDYPADGPGYLHVKENKFYPLAVDVKVKATIEDEFYINYLLSTKGNGGAAAKISIIDNITRSTIVSFEEKAETGWQRKINKFRLTPAGQKDISIRLEAQAGAVYFDDVSIQPVLKTSSDSYSVPECRLYPTNDSLTCTSKNANVISDGLEGYCIEKDPSNPDVCLMWYPMDNIPLPTMSSMGYNGNFPLNYCTRTSGNFDLMERRTGYHLKYENENEPRILTAAGNWIILSEDNNAGNQNKCIKFDGTGGRPEARCQYPGNYNLADDNYVLWLSFHMGCSGCDNHIHYICVPKADRLVDANGVSMVDNAVANHGNSVNGGDWEECEGDTYSTGYAVFNGFTGFEAGQAVAGYIPDPVNPDPNPNLKIIDYKFLATGYGDLKLIPGTNNDPLDTNYYNFTCDQVVETVDASGGNSMWVDRTKSGTTTAFSFSTTTYEMFNINISQDRENPPFGGLVGQISQGDGPVSLADIVKDSFSGIPYGCVDGVGKNCKYIGYCSNNPNILCIATSTSPGTSLSAATCTGSGTCSPLFSPYIDFNSASDMSLKTKNLLKNISLVGKNSLDNINGFYRPSPINTTAQYNFTAGYAGAPNVVTTRQGYEYKAVLPEIKNVKLFFNDNYSLLGTSEYDVRQKGIYRLEFNTEVDKEQQPLKRIVIDWGDGYEQTITNQDHMPPSGGPHVFYHYYYKTGLKDIGVTIYDNWNFYSSF